VFVSGRKSPKSSNWLLTGISFSYRPIGMQEIKIAESTLFLKVDLILFNFQRSGWPRDICSRPIKMQEIKIAESSLLLKVDLILFYFLRSGWPRDIFSRPIGMQEIKKAKSSFLFKLDLTYLTYPCFTVFAVARLN